MTYSFDTGNEAMYGIDTNRLFYDEGEFAICVENQHCLDYNGCTADTCNQELRICENANNTDDMCHECSWVTIEITPDNYPEETSWFVKDVLSKNLVLSGDPYPSYSVGESFFHLVRCKFNINKQI